MPHPPSRRPNKPYRVLVSLLYSRFVWADRAPDGSISANAVQYARALGLRTQSLHQALAQLHEQGLLDQLVWRKAWFRARPACPPGLSRLVRAPGEPGDTGGGLPHAVLTAPEVIDV
jgi:hypothetical protein